jgi:hypothetical protein
MMSLLISLVLAEGVARIADGRGIFGGPLYLGTPQIVPIAEYERAIDDRSDPPALWQRSPPPLPNRHSPEPADLQKYQEFGNRSIPTEHSGGVTQAELFKVWNANILGDVCHDDVLKHLVRWPLKAFDPGNDDTHPRYRYPPNTTWPTGLVTNQLGWRGKPVEDRTDRTIRIIFVGASTTAEAHAIPWSAPELLDEWLNDWAAARRLDVKFQVLNAAREGASTTDVVSIVRDEVLPLKPDLVVFYEGALQFDWSSVVKGAQSLRALPRPRYEDLAGWVVDAARQSSLFTHVLRFLNSTGISAAGQVPEGRKPAYEIAWPAGLSETDPDIWRHDLPLNLPAILKDFGAIRSILAAAGSEFALSSFAWMVDDGMKVDPIAGRYIWGTNNEVYWPWTYHDLRRGVDFENRVYRKFAKEHDLPFLDVARLIPRAQPLFADGVHMTESGVRVKAWAFFHELTGLIEKRLAEKEWPRSVADPAISSYPVRTLQFDCATAD